MGHMYGCQGILQSRWRSRLGHGDDVWDDSLVLEAPVVGARPAKASLHLVCYANAANLPHHLHSTPKSKSGLELPARALPKPVCSSSAMRTPWAACTIYAACRMHVL